MNGRVVWICFQTFFGFIWGIEHCMYHTKLSEIAVANSYNSNNLDAAYSDLFMASETDYRFKLNGHCTLQVFYLACTFYINFQDDDLSVAVAALRGLQQVFVHYLTSKEMYGEHEREQPGQYL